MVRENESETERVTRLFSKQQLFKYFYTVIINSIEKSNYFWRVTVCDINLSFLPSFARL